MVSERYRRSVKTGLIAGLALTGLVFASFSAPEAKTLKHLALRTAHKNTVSSLAELDRMRQGSDHMAAGDYASAIALWTKAVEKDPVNIVVTYNLAYAYYQMAMQTRDRAEALRLLDESEAAFQRVQTLNPELDVVYFKLGKIALVKGDDMQAAAYYRLGLQYDPGNAALQFNLARVYDQLQDYGNAITHYEKAIALDPEFKYAYNNLGLIHELRGSKAAAEKAYLAALKQDPAYNFARLNLGNLYADMDRLPEAKKLYLEALKLEPDNAYAHLYLGNAYFMTAEFDEAVRHYRISITRKPDNASAYYLLAISLSKLNRADEAMAAGMQYMALDPNGRFADEIQDLIISLKLQQQAGPYAARKITLP